MKHIAKKRFGQNFLNDDYIIGQIIDIIAPSKDDFLVEIGPGLAALTRPLLNKVPKLHVIELDRDIIHFLNTNFPTDKLIVHEGDALKFNYSFSEYVNAQKIRVVGNLPYNISTPLLFHLAEHDNILDMHFMLQKEVVDRICASPGNADYGRLSIMLQYKFDCHKMLDVGRECFTPSPKVESAIVRLKPKPHDLWQHINEKKLNHIVTAAFSKRRKTIRNSLNNIVSIEKLANLGIDSNNRAENLSVNDYLKLATVDTIS
jgi:16S rRNA (adenine1518-N6/adenine1519-N6)-dimethyltransferase